MGVMDMEDDKVADMVLSLPKGKFHKKKCKKVW